MDKDKIIIYRKRRAKGEDGYKTFSVRVKEETVMAMTNLVDESGCSRNELVNIFLEWGITHYQIEDDESEDTK